MTSGAIQQGVPTKVFLDLCRSPESNKQADTPKSPSLTAPRESMRTLPALTSRWMWPWWWRYSKPFNTSLSTVAITTSSNPSGCAAFNMWRHEPPDMNGITTHRLWSLTNEQCDFSTLGWSTSTIVCASRDILFCIHSSINHSINS